MQARPLRLAEAVLAQDAVTFQAQLPDCALSLTATTPAPAQWMLLARGAVSQTTAHEGLDPGYGDAAMVDYGSA